jgi:hypothetical protein
VRQERLRIPSLPRHTLQREWSYFFRKSSRSSLGSRSAKVPNRLKAEHVAVRRGISGVGLVTGIWLGAGCGRRPRAAESLARRGCHPDVGAKSVAGAMTKAARSSKQIMHSRRPRTTISALIVARIFMEPREGQQTAG